MNNEWIAVARGLKCISVSITWNIVAFWLAVTAFVFLFLQYNMGPKGVLLPLEWLLLPTGLVMVVAFLYSRVGRLLILRVPGSVPSAKFYALGWLVFGLIGQTGFGLLIAYRVFVGFLELETFLALGGTSLLFLIAGGVFFHRALTKIANTMQYPDALAGLNGSRVLTYFGLIFLAVGIAMMWGAGGGAAVVVLVVFGFFGFGALGIATVMYSWAVQSLRFSALREALRRGEGSEGPHE